MKNAMQLKAIIRNLAKEKHISAQLIMQNYMLERLLERISIVVGGIACNCGEPWFDSGGSRLL